MILVEFKEAMNNANIPTAQGGFVNSFEEAESVVESIGFPVIIRPSFTLGGTGGSIAYNAEDFKELIQKGLSVHRSISTAHRAHR